MNNPNNSSTTLNFGTATVEGVISHAFTMTPAILIAHIEGLVRQHMKYAIETKDHYAARAAIKLAQSLSHAAVLLADRPNPVPQIMRDISLFVPTYNAACDVLNLPHPVRAAIAARDPAMN